VVSAIETEGPGIHLGPLLCAAMLTRRKEVKTMSSENQSADFMKWLYKKINLANEHERNCVEMAKSFPGDSPAGRSSRELLRRAENISDVLENVRIKAVECGL
jgi:hypothetical protein